MKVSSNSAKDTFDIGFKLSKFFKGGETIALFGGMGQGKTVFVKGFVSGLGCSEIVTSPTFTILNQYSAKFLINHYDMYRVKTIEDLYSTAFFDYISDKNSITIIEWSENIKEYLPKDSIFITISSAAKDNERTIEIEGINIKHEDIST